MSPLNVERNKTYDRLVVVQEDLLHHVKGMMVSRGGWKIAITHTYNFARDCTCLREVYGNATPVIVSGFGQD